MKEIPLTRGHSAIVDDEDYHWLARHRWFVKPDRRTHYAARKMTVARKKQRDVSMHRIILNAPAGVYVDHINGNGLDNRRSNLRLCTFADNIRNRGKLKDGTSQYKGVHRLTNSIRWCARITHDGRTMSLGCYASELSAARAYDRAAILKHGEFARTNILRPLRMA